MILGVIIQQPTEMLDYDIDFESWFDGEEDAVSTATTNVVQSTGVGGNLTAFATKAAPAIMKIWLSGGADGEVYTVEVTTTTTSGRVKQDELEVRIQEFI